MRAAAALAFAVALRMSLAGRGGSEDEVEEVDEAEDEGGGLEEKLAVFCCRGKDFADELSYLVDLLVSGGKGAC